MKVKCWELEKCGKSECPVYGKMNERCWLVSGTHCRDEIQGMFLNKIEICLKCDVFKNNVSADEREWWRTLDFADRQFKQYVEMIEKQRESILQLSSPVIPILEKILVLPLVGVLDEERAQFIIEKLLKKIADLRATVIIVYITGVAEVNRHVAEHLLKTAETTHLMGCTCIFTGINPGAAVSLANSGMDLSGLNTRTTLQSGLELAFELTKIKVVRCE